MHFNIYVLYILYVAIIYLNEIRYLNTLHVFK